MIKGEFPSVDADKKALDITHAARKTMRGLIQDHLRPHYKTHISHESEGRWFIADLLAISPCTI